MLAGNHPERPSCWHLLFCPSKGQQREELEFAHVNACAAILQGRGKLSAVARAGLAAAAADVGWSHEGLSRFLQAVMPQPRAQLQSYEYFGEHLLHADWVALLSQSHNFHAKWATLAARLEVMVLGNPSCPTFGMIAATMILACQHSGHEVASPMADLLQRYLKMVKSAWRASASKPPGPNRLNRLPASTLMLYRQYPSAYALMFPAGDASTCAPLIPWSQVNVVASLIKLRGGTSADTSGRTIAAQAPLPIAFYPHAAPAAAPQPLLPITDQLHASAVASACSAGASAGAVAADACGVDIPQVWW